MRLKLLMGIMRRAISCLDGLSRMMVILTVLKTISARALSFMLTVRKLMVIHIHQSWILQNYI